MSDELNRFSRASRRNLDGVHPELVRLHNAVLPVFDHAVTDGARSLEEQAANVARGVSKTMDSKHLPQADGLAHATDAEPYPRPDWSAVERALDAVRQVDPQMHLCRFYYYQGVVRGVASQLNIPIRQGVDWDRDTVVGDQSFHDLPHTELHFPPPPDP